MWAVVCFLQRHCVSHHLAVGTHRHSGKRVLLAVPQYSVVAGCMFGLFISSAFAVGDRSGRLLRLVGSTLVHGSIRQCYIALAQARSAGHGN